MEIEIDIDYPKDFTVFNEKSPGEAEAEFNRLFALCDATGEDGVMLVIACEVSESRNSDGPAWDPQDFTEISLDDWSVAVGPNDEEEDIKFLNDFVAHYFSNEVTDAFEGATT